MQHLIGGEPADDGCQRHTAVGHGDVNVGGARQRAHHGQFVARHRPEAEREALQCCVLCAGKEPADSSEDSPAVIVAQLSGGELLRVRTDSLVRGRGGWIGRIGADHRAVFHLLERHSAGRVVHQSRQRPHRGAVRKNPRSVLQGEREAGHGEDTGRIDARGDHQPIERDATEAGEHALQASRVQIEGSELAWKQHPSTRRGGRSEESLRDVHRIQVRVDR
jgi:hypothetical protein